MEGQSGTTKYYKFTPSEMLSHISHNITLYPADIITLGTPFPRESSPSATELRS